jgi:hypothetical protein
MSQPGSKSGELAAHSDVMPLSVSASAAGLGCMCARLSLTRVRTFRAESRGFFGAPRQRMAAFVGMNAKDVEGVSGNSVRVGAIQDLLALNIDLAPVMCGCTWACSDQSASWCPIRVRRRHRVAQWTTNRRARQERPGDDRSSRDGPEPRGLRSHGRRILGGRSGHRFRKPLHRAVRERQQLLAS